MSKLKPKLFSILPRYTKKQFVQDLLSGTIVAIIALPLSIALAIASGVSPEKGLITAIIGGFIVSFFGGSRVQIAGPTGAFMVIVLGTINEYGFNGLLISMILAGIIMIIFGLLRLGSVVKFIPYPIIAGFTAGIAVVIFTSQIGDFFGLNISHPADNFLGKLGQYFANINQINLTATIIGIISFIIVWFWPNVSKKIPGSLVAVILLSLLVSIFHLDVDTIGSKYTSLTNVFPAISLPSISLSKISNYIQPAIAIAFLGSVESLLSAVVSDGMIGSRHNSNMELVAQGGANIASALFGGIPVTGAIARTVANINNGGRTPIAGIVHSLVLLLMFLILMPLVKLIPIPTLAAILFVVAINMSDYKEFKSLLKSPFADSFVLISTFLLTIFVDLVVAIEAGMIMSLIFLLKRMSDLSNVTLKTLDYTESDQFEKRKDVTVESPRELLSSSLIQIYEINGPFFFGAAHKYIEAIQTLDHRIKDLIIVMEHVPSMDATALHYFESSIKTCNKKKIRISLVLVQEQPLELLKRANVIHESGNIHTFTLLQDAIDFANLKESE